MFQIMDLFVLGGDFTLVTSRSNGEVAMEKERKWERTLMFFFASIARFARHV